MISSAARPFSPNNATRIALGAAGRPTSSGRALFGRGRAWRSRRRPRSLLETARSPCSIFSDCSGNSDTEAFDTLRDFFPTVFPPSIIVPHKMLECQKMLCDDVRGIIAFYRHNLQLKEVLDELESYKIKNQERHYYQSWWLPSPRFIRIRSKFYTQTTDPPAVFIRTLSR